MNRRERPGPAHQFAGDHHGFRVLIGSAFGEDTPDASRLRLLTKCHPAKVVSLFEPHTHTIRRSKPCPYEIEFGPAWKVIAEGNPPHVPYLPSA